MMQAFKMIFHLINQQRRKKRIKSHQCHAHLTQIPILILKAVKRIQQGIIILMLIAIRIVVTSLIQNHLLNPVRRTSLRPN